MDSFYKFIFYEKKCRICVFKLFGVFLLLTCMFTTFLFSGCRGRGVGRENISSANADAAANRRNVSANSSANGASIKITATFYPLYIMLLNITDGVEGVELSLLAPAGTGCLHDYELTVRDMKTISECDILVANGAGMESFMERAISQVKGNIIVAAENFPMQSEIPFLEENAHIWVSPAGAIYEVEQITRKLAQLDKARAEQYLANAKKYVSKLRELQKEMHVALDKFSGSQIVTFHEAFPYFAHEFDLELASVIEREPGTAPSAKELSETVAIIKEALADGKKISLFAEPQYASSAAEVIASETGLQVYLLDPCVTGELEKDAYINAMKTNSTVLAKALG